MPRGRSGGKNIHGPTTRQWQWALMSGPFVTTSSAAKSIRAPKAIDMHWLQYVLGYLQHTVSKRTSTWGALIWTTSFACRSAPFFPIGQVGAANQWRDLQIRSTPNWLPEQFGSSLVVALLWRPTSNHLGGRWRFIAAEFPMLIKRQQNYHRSRSGLIVQTFADRLCQPSKRLEIILINGEPGPLCTSGGCSSLVEPKFSRLERVGQVGQLRGWLFLFKFRRAGRLCAISPRNGLSKFKRSELEFHHWECKSGRA